MVDGGNDGRPFRLGRERVAPATVRLDPATGEVVQRVAGVGGGGIAIGYGSVWVAEYKRNTVARIDPCSATVIERIRSERADADRSRGRRHLGDDAASAQRGLRISPRTRETVAVIPVPPTTRRIATGGGYVWVTSGSSGEPGAPHTPGVLSKIDPRTNRIAAAIKLCGFRPDGVAFAEGRVWVAVAPA